jgi:peptidoglycan hydrolase-like protein with peptidoglycan-binding domain
VAQNARQLKSLRHYSGEPTDLYGPELAGAVARYQQSSGLVADGELGKKTYGRLFEARVVRAKAGKGRKQKRRGAE